jgi:putative DNA primase/helicase
MSDIRDALVDLGIELKRYTFGEHRVPCPWCDKGPKDDALAVKLDADGAIWHCHRCHEKGAARNRDRTFTPDRQQPIGQERHEVLSSWGRTLWEASQPIDLGSIAATYLTGRGCALLPEDGDLRWHPALSDRMSGYTGPALVALVTRIEDGAPINLHRTWLAADGRGKAVIDKPRRLLKGHSSHDGVIRLWPDDAVTNGLVVGEGVETCLAAAHAGLTPCWSTIYAGNMAGFPVLPGLEGITILVDHDRAHPKTGKRAGIEAAKQLVARYIAAGFDPRRDIKVILPPTEGEDAADLEKGTS